MVDLHTHILYGVDDGAQTIEEAFSMLEIAASIRHSHDLFNTTCFSSYRNM